MIRLFIPVILLVLTGVVSGRTFTNQKGQTFEASLVSADSTAVELMGKDGKKYKVAVNALSAEDKKFCTDWLAANPVMKLTVKTEGFVEKGTRATNNELEARGSASLMSRTRTVKEGYRITVSNWSKDPGAKVSGLKVDYVIVVGYTDTHAKDRRGVKEVVKGSLDLPELTGTKPQAVATQTVATGQSAAVATRTVKDSNGDSATAAAAALYRESMDGICLIIKHGDRIVARHVYGRVPRQTQLEFMQ